jgi:hypothetical protein
MVEGQKVKRKGKRSKVEAISTLRGRGRWKDGTKDDRRMTEG